jgi:hypothetical protein
MSYGGQYVSRGSAPASIQTVAILQYIGGLITLAGAVLFALLAAKAVNLPDNPASRYVAADAETRLFVVGAVVLGISALIAILLGRKVQRGRNWARWVLILLSLLSLVSTVYQSYQLGNSRYYGGLVIPVLYLILLNTRAARSWCRYHTY